MIIGLTYDLRREYLDMGYSELETAEFDRGETIDAIENTLRELGHQTDRIGHAKALIGRLVKGDRWDIVFNIAEGLHGIGREAQVPAILDLYEIPYTFSDPLVSSLTLHKGMTKRVIRDAGVPTPDFFVVDNADTIDRVDIPFPLFVKPIAEGTGKGITPASVVHHLEDLAPICRKLISEYHQPVLVEHFLPGREFTVGITGTGKDAIVLGTMEVHLLENAEPNVYSYINKERCEELVEYRIVDPHEDAVVQKAESVTLAAWRVLECRDAGRADLRCDEYGNPQFMEVNPLAGIHPEHSDLPIICNRLNIPYKTLIERIIQSASKRIRINH